MTDDKILIKGIKNGDTRIFEKVYMEYFSRLCRLSEKIVGDTVIAEDIVQHLFFNLWEKRKAINIDHNLGGYLARSTYNSSLQHIRNNLIHTKHHDKILKNSIDNPDEIEYHIDIAGDSEQVEKLRRAIDNLPEQCKEILKMSRFENKKSIDIAESMGLSVRTVENQIYIALKKLRDNMKTILDWLSFLKISL